MSTFAPIAIVGQGCVLPGALSSDALWDIVRQGRSSLAPAPDTAWELHPAADREVLGAQLASRVGGYVRGFDDVFSPHGFLVPVDPGLDAVFLWPLHCAREALRSARLEIGPARPRASVVLGNLSYPTPALARYARDVWTGATPTVDPRSRFMSGLPAQLVARAIGFGGAAFCLDAACASSLYAIKLACDALNDGSSDLVIAGGVNHADDLFLHLGFTALSALSKTGQSRPFHRAADGLVPAQGAAVVLLKRLEDAHAAGDPILGVIRGIGLSNDGRSRGLLVPSEEGQTRAMRQAYAGSGLSPRDVSLVECHATGTSVGDAIEIASLRAVFEGATDIPVGSLKSNLGHLVTAAGAAALLKVLGAFRAGERPPSIGADEVIDAVGGAVRVVREVEPWPSDGPRRAAVSAFGFGGNNAHLIVEEWRPPIRPRIVASPAAPPVAIAVVARAVHVGAASTTAELDRALVDGRPIVLGDPPQAAIASFDLDTTGLRFPPADVKDAIAQQTLLLKTALAAVASVDALPPERTAILVGMQCDAEAARCGLRWRSPNVDDPALLAPLRAAVTVGCMPNMVANRVNQQLGFAAPSFTVSAEEASGTVALDLAVRALSVGEIDAAIVGAVDLSCEPVSRAAAGAVSGTPTRPGADAAVVLVLKRLDDARRDGDHVSAIVEPAAPKGSQARLLETTVSPDDAGLEPLLGHAHAASGLVHVAAAIGACERRAQPGPAGTPASPWLPPGSGATPAARVRVRTIGDQVTETHVCGADPPRAPLEPRAPRLAFFAGRSLEELSRAVGSRAQTEPTGDYRVAIVGAGAEELDARIERAARRLRTANARIAPGPLEDGIWYGEGPAAGEVAFVFTGPAGAYRQMGRDLAFAFPERIGALASRMGSLREAAGWIYEEPEPDSPRIAPIQKLWGSSFLIQLHAELTRGLLRMRPHASIGYCSGETNALFAFGAWSDLDGFRRAIDDFGVYARELAGELRCVRRAWNVADDTPVAWSTLRVRAPVEDVRAALRGETRAHLTIINGGADAIVAGDPAACARVAERIGARRVTPLEYDFVMHCPEARGYASEWRRLHHRPTARVPGVRFYTHATLGSYAPTDDAAADALLGQAMNVVDFPALVRKAYADGVRVFVEHGPHAGCTKWIGEALGAREHLAVALDQYGRSSLAQFVESAARLAAAGVPLDHRALAERLAPRAPAATAPSTRASVLTLPAHLPPVRFASDEPARAQPGIRHEHDVQIMTPAPRLGTHLVRLADTPPPSGPAAAVERLAAHHERLASMHADYLRIQSEASARFMQTIASVQRLSLTWNAARTSPCSGEGSMPVARSHVRSVVLQGSFEPLRSHSCVPARVTGRDERLKIALTHRVPRRGGAGPVLASGPSPSTPSSSSSGPGFAAPRRRAPTGPRFGRADLERLASGPISEVFGPAFRAQDAYARQVRMPEPPLLLADRVVGIDGEPGSLGRGIIWTETDVRSDAWYLHEGRMPAGILVESGQADLLLISWLGIDAHNRGERVYRLLGCDLTSHGPLPQPSDTLSYEIHVDGHARQGDVRLFFFHYDCYVDGELRVSVRNGQAGFFADAELAASAGILWSAEEREPTREARVAPPRVRCTKTRLTADDLSAFVAGDVRGCFGPGFERAQTHTRTPTIQGGRMRLVDEVTAFEPSGGPWRRGYLRARLALSPDSWFFAGHFKNDPCMPGTLMFEGCLQAMAVYLTAMGYTLERDGWRFEPVPDEKYELRCRGQATPSSKEVVYEIFVDELVDGPIPTLYADLLGTVDGLKAFHCRRMGLRLVPAFPLDRGRLDAATPAARTSGRPVARAGEFSFDERSVLACAWGRPSDAFGPMYAPFDHGKRVPRLPGPPYLFMSRILRVDGPIGGMQIGSVVESEYDVPEDAWYFSENGDRVMPFAVLLEVALQPCGWLSSYVGCTLETADELSFRNLDGTGTVLRHVRPGTGALVTRARLTSLSRVGALTVVGFDVSVSARGGAVYELKTVFGFFTRDAMRDQAGLPTTADERARLVEPCDSPAREIREASGGGGRAPKIAAGRLLMLDRVTGVWPAGGPAGLGRLRAEMRVDPSQWFFKAHFFQDPVQPGSLGIEAMIQAVQLLAIEKGLAQGLDDARFEPIAAGVTTTWKYRGQVLPENSSVVVDMGLTRVAQETNGWLVIADGSLWADGKRIYAATGVGVRIVGDRRAETG